MHCPFCGKNQYPQNDDDQFQNGPPGDSETVLLAFDNGRVYRIPVYMDHAIIAHEYQPPASLIGDLMNWKRVPLDLVHPAVAANPTDLKIDANFHYGTGPGAPASVPYRLRAHIRAALAEQVAV